MGGGKLFHYLRVVVSLRKTFQGHIGSTAGGVDFLEHEGIALDIIRIACTSKVLSVRGQVVECTRIRKSCELTCKAQQNMLLCTGLDCFVDGGRCAARIVQLERGIHARWGSSRLLSPG